jgi:hypothetical protein
VFAAICARKLLARLSSGYVICRPKEILMRATTSILFATLFLGTSLSWADVVELKTGQRVEGSFKQATSEGVVIEVGGQAITFELERVRAIYFGTAPASAPVALQKGW